MTEPSAPPSARQTELLEAAYRYVLEHGLADLSLRPLAAAIGTSPRVLLYLFGSKDGLVRALFARARVDELALIDELTGRERSSGRDVGQSAGLAAVAERVWAFLSAPEHRALLALWVEAYARSLIDADGHWVRFARDSVAEWLTLLAAAQPEDERDTPAGLARRTLVLAVLRGALLDLLATGDVDRVTAAVDQHLATL